MIDGRTWYDVLPAPQIDDDAPLRSLEELGAAFPSVVRANGGRQTDPHLKAPRPSDKCRHGVFTWEACARCDAAFDARERRREEAMQWPD
jgi:hypothetical protein